MYIWTSGAFVPCISCRYACVCWRAWATLQKTESTIGPQCTDITATYFVSMPFFVFLQPEIERVKVKERIQSIIRWKRRPTWAMTSRMKKKNGKKDTRFAERNGFKFRDVWVRLHNRFVDMPNTPAHDPNDKDRIRYLFRAVPYYYYNYHFIFFWLLILSLRMELGICHWHDMTLWRTKMKPQCLVSRDIGKKGVTSWMIVL